MGLLLLCAACGDPSHANGAPDGNTAPDLNGTASASCVGPYLNDQPPSGPFRGAIPTVRPGGTIRIYGHWYTSTCNDTGGHDPLEPLRPVHLILTLPGGAVEPLGEFTPGGRHMGFSTRVHIPAGAPAGSATVSDDREYPATYGFEIGK